MKNYLFIGILLVIFSACSKHKHEGPLADHSHNTMLQLSGYNEKYELFVEADPFAIGKSSRITVFLTSLDNFKPIHTASITANLIIDTKGVRQIVDMPSSEGIYIFKLQPEAEGEGKLVFDIRTVTGITQIQIPGIKVYEDAHTAEHIAEDEAIENANAVTFTKAQSWKIDFSTTLPVLQSFGQVIKTTARIQSSQSDEVIIPARTGGIVAFSGNVIVEGKGINAGQELFSISGAGMADNSVNVRFIEARSNYQKAEADYVRAQELVKEKIVSDKEFLQIKTDYETTKAVYDNLYKNFEERGQKVFSPISGFVKQLFITNGQYVEAGQALFSVSKNRSLLLVADLQPKYASLLPFVSTANIVDRESGSTYSLEELNGKVLSFSRTINEENYRMPITFQIDNKADFISGSFVELYIKTKSEKLLLTVPNSAILEDQGLFFVFVQLTPEIFEKREVEIGITDGVYTEIKSGLTQNDRVVAKGAVSVKLAQSAGALDPHAGHVH